MRCAAARGGLQHIVAQLRLCLAPRCTRSLVRSAQHSRRKLCVASHAADRAQAAVLPAASVEEVLSAAFSSLGRSAKPAEISTMVRFSSRGIAAGYQLTVC